jgi:signal transduction histidine kinase
MIKSNLIRLSRRYTSALRVYLEQGADATSRGARGLGRDAAGMGLETLDMARIHEEALLTLDGAGMLDGEIKRADNFFSEAVSPIERTHLAALKAHAYLSQVHEKLNRRTSDLAASNLSLKKSVLQRKMVEEALRERGGHSRKLLEESRRLQKHLRALTHRILAAQENKRKKVSSDLQNEIAQTLLGINVRLLTLKQEARVRAENLQKEIASTRRLVEKSMKSIKRVTREFGKEATP